ncbi:hypothetical protein KIN20_022863 [Parelaphostrongylus tenuis]|uniref:Uncharacterized protein n=1 Tax=Parelaphostrongylus tenuis TaxID=148309 RepID=A0AAD5MQV2_PARTN|nr:hypothetical protein KIN20_022863 [Parelaphostrongylus tenuis]
MLDIGYSLLLELKECGEISRTVMPYITHIRTFFQEHITDEQNAEGKIADICVSDSQKTNTGRGPEYSASLPAEKQDSPKSRDQKKAELVENVAAGRRRIQSDQTKWIVILTML